MSESKTIEIHLDNARELKKMLNVKVTVIPMIIGVQGTVGKGLRKKTGGIGD